jgi:hypothetical protein
MPDFPASSTAFVYKTSLNFRHNLRRDDVRLPDSVTRIAIPSKGRLQEPSEALLKAARGFVWEALVSPADYEQSRGRLKVTRAVRQAEGVQARVVSREQPFPAARAVEPDLEDAFVHLMQSAA